MGNGKKREVFLVQGGQLASTSRVFSEINTRTINSILEKTNFP